MSTLNMKLTAKLLWMGAEFWNESQKLLSVAEAANDRRKTELGNDSNEVFVWRRYINQ